MNVTKEHIYKAVDKQVFHLVGEVADEMKRECYVVGGYVRDVILGRPSVDMDFVTVGSGIEVAQAVAARLGRKAHLSVFKTYGTAQVRTHKWELEFVGARRESYRRESRNPIVEDGTLSDDQLRRDFTVNAMAISVNAATFGQLVDPFDGIGDIERHLIKTPRDPNITFDDDPLRMMRAVRFATQLGFDIEATTFDAIKRNCARIDIITRERIADELMKIVRAKQPSRGFDLLDKSGLLRRIFPDLDALKGVETVNGRGHKDNFRHTLQVLDNVAAESDNEWLRWAALLHDIGKPRTKQWVDGTGWTFHNHNYVGSKMVPRIFKQLKLPQNEHMKYVMKLVDLHMRPIALVEDGVTDSAIRRLLFDAGDDIDDLMILCKADITSKNQQKVQRFRENFDLVKQKLIDIEEKDRVRNFQPPIDGQTIMDTYGLKPSQQVGLIKDAIKDAILDGEISNSYAEAYALMRRRAHELGLDEVHAAHLCHTTTETPIGTLTIAATATGIAMVTTQRQATEELEMLSKRLKLTPVEAVTPLMQQCINQLKDYFAGTLQTFDLPLQLTGTDFQQRAWQVLQGIPYGTTISYAEEAKRLGSPRATRAVGMANHNNPILIIIPCHRVIAADGTLGGYAEGTDLKRFLLHHETYYKNK